ncbi:ECF-type sigma factor [Wenzhouxiangella sp. XN24]|uniref:ECF-type sigma factor n=1 Tax=Wenzhouxiangella sp. XN24 TaxID=2713569 RepID=UPI0013EC6051|nr:ECF-type sigma factor [Wenzhouxiangella sp. XN24]NGX16107.1 sigma-70 family RNA polymerase sigma factor [Wenzhouxiangella sp. XN24]
MGDVTVLLRKLNAGDLAARETLLALIYSELTAIAARHLAGERHERELEPQALVHEGWLRMVELKRITWQDREHFLAMAARVMRQVLVDAARKRNAAKRDGGLQVTLSGLAAFEPDSNTDVLQLHEALERLAEIDPRRAELVELRYFGGLTIEEIAEFVGSSPATVKRNWDVARGWLFRAMTTDADEGADPR